MSVCSGLLPTWQLRSLDDSADSAVASRSRRRSRRGTGDDLYNSVAQASRLCTLRMQRAGEALALRKNHSIRERLAKQTAEPARFRRVAFLVKNGATLGFSLPA